MNTPINLEITIMLPPITKKNSGQIVRAGNRTVLLPSKRYRDYEAKAGWFLPRLDAPIGAPVNVLALYYMPTRRRVDLTNPHGALHDVLVHYGVLADDNSKIVVSTDGSRVLYDKHQPRTEVRITGIQASRGGKDAG